MQHKERGDASEYLCRAIGHISQASTRIVFHRPYLVVADRHQLEVVENDVYQSEISVRDKEQHRSAERLFPEELDFNVEADEAIIDVERYSTSVNQS